MQTDIKYRPAYSLAVVILQPNERIRVDAGAMVSMSADMTLETKAQGGILASLGRSLLGGKSFFQNTYQAGANGGEITLAPPLPGDIFTLEIQDEVLLLQSGAYVASSESINLDTKWTGAKTFFSREGPIMLRTSGSGTLIFASYGAIHERNLASGRILPGRYRSSGGLQRWHALQGCSGGRLQIDSVGRRGPGGRADRPRPAADPDPQRRCLPFLAAAEDSQEQ